MVGSRARLSSSPFANEQRAGTHALDAIAFETLDIREAGSDGTRSAATSSRRAVQYAQELLAKRRFADCVIETNTRGAARAAARSARAVDAQDSFPDDPFGQAVRAASKSPRSSERFR
jgi:hypothetical protein